MPGVWPIVAIAVVVAVVFCPLIMPTGESAGSNNTALEFTQNQPKMKAKKITNKTTIGNATQKRLDPSADEIFKKIDVNGDGYLTLDEFRTAYEKGLLELKREGRRVSSNGNDERRIKHASKRTHPA